MGHRYKAYFSTRSFFNPGWFSLLHLSQNFSCGFVHLLILSTFPTDEHGMSSGVRFESIFCKALSSMFVDLRFARSTALRPHSHATSGFSSSFPIPQSLLTGHMNALIYTDPVDQDGRTYSK